MVVCYLTWVSLNNWSCIFEEFEFRNRYMPISKFLKLVHHQIEQNKTFSMIPHSLHNKGYFWSYDEKYDIFSYNFFVFQQLKSQISQIDKIDISVLNLNSSFLLLFSSAEPARWRCSELKKSVQGQEKELRNDCYRNAEGNYNDMMIKCRVSQLLFGL